MLHPYWITDINAATIGISPCPSGGEAMAKDLEKIKDTKPLLVVSLMQEQESKILGLEQEQSECMAAGLDYLSFPIIDHSIPGYTRFVDIIEQLYGRTNQEGRILIHCHHGIGRSSLISLGLMVKHGLPLKESIATVTKTIGYQVPTALSQRKLLSAYYKNLAG